MITEKNDGMKNSKGKRKLSEKKWRSGEVSIRKYSVYVFEVANNEFSVRFYE